MTTDEKIKTILALPKEEIIAFIREAIQENRKGIQTMAAETSKKRAPKKLKNDMFDDNSDSELF